MDSIELDRAAATDAIAYFIGLGTKPARTLADAIARLLAREAEQHEALRAVREAPVVRAGEPVGAIDMLMRLGYYSGTPVRLVPVPHDSEVSRDR